MITNKNITQNSYDTKVTVRIVFFLWMLPALQVSETLSSKGHSAITP